MSTAAERFRNVRDAFDAAQSLAGDERVDYLVRLRADQPDLADEVAALLDAQRPTLMADSRAPTETAEVRQPSNLQASSLDSQQTQALSDEAAPQVMLDLHAAEQQLFPKLPGYDITGRLGEGGMGTVWRAVQLSTRRVVALKLMGASSLGSPKARRRFEREVELAAQLEHPNVARVYDSGLLAGVCFYAMELVVGGMPLNAYVTATKPGDRGVVALVE